MNIVGLGSSAGGLSALKEFFARMAPDSDNAFVVIQHLMPDGPALTRDILTRITSMVVMTAQDGLRVLPNHVYTMAPSTQLIIAKGLLVVTPRTEMAARHHPFDRFLKSLADDCGDGAIAVVFSGYDGDGTEGFAAIKAAGGITYAQDESATVDEMPASAIATGNVDHVLSAGQIADHLSHAQVPRGPVASSAGTGKRHTSDPRATH